MGRLSRGFDRDNGTLTSMGEQLQGKNKEGQSKPGEGVDRTQIRRLLQLTPGERLEVFIASARNVAELVAGARIV